MSDRTLIGVLRVTVVIGGVLAVIGSAAFLVIGHGGSWWSEGGSFVALFAVFFAVFGWLLIPRQPRNAVVLTMAASAFFGGLFLAGWAGAVLVVDDANLALVLVDAGSVVPTEASPASVAWILMFTEPAVVLAFFPLLTFGLLLFPDGRLSSPPWRWVGVLAALSIVFVVVVFAWGFRPGNTVRADKNLLLDAGFMAVVLAAIVSLVALAGRFRRSSGETREQFKWVVWCASIFVPALVVAVSLGGSRYEDLTIGPFMVATVVFLVSYGIAVGRYRLFDIDVVISRTVVVAGLAGLITLVYAAVVGGVGLVFGAGTDAALPLSVAATVVVAIAFQPVRARMRRWANRLVYGERATPYEVLSRFSARMRDVVATEDVIPQMAQLLTQGTGATQAIVWMTSGDELQPAASWPEENVVPPAASRTDGELSIPGVDHIASVEHDGELLGAVTVTMPRGEPMTATEEWLVDDVASQAGLVLRNARLIQQLRSSRQRLVAAQNEERRRLERDLHDGAQQQLVALKIKLGLARRIDDATKRDDMLGALMEDTDDAIHSLRNLARGIYPPVLADEGLVRALRG